MNKNLTIIISIAVILALIGIVYYYNISKTADQNVYQNNNDQVAVENNTIKNNQNAEALNPVEFTLNAKRWEYTPSVINVKKGQKVKITINNTDTKHGINLPDFNVSGENSVEFVADKVGEFEFACNIFCGQGHKDMKGKIIVSE